MSQLNIGGVQPQQVNQAGVQQAQGAEQKHEVPQELQNARVSTSLFAKIGHAIASLAHGISEAAAYIARGIAAGLKSICSHFSVSDKAPEPRLSGAGALMPNEREDIMSVAIFNSEIKDCIDGKRPQKLPDAFLNAGNDACAEVGALFSGGFTISNMADLVNNSRCKMALNKALVPFSKGAGGKLTPERFGEIVKQTVFRHAKLTMLANKISHVLEKSGEAHDEKTCFKLANMVIADPAMKEQFENASAAPTVGQFLDDAEKVIGDTLALDKKLPDCKKAALADAIGKLAKLLNIPENEVESKVKLDGIDEKLTFVVSLIRSGEKHATLSSVQEQFDKAVDKFINNLDGMFKDFESCPVSDKQKGEWKTKLLNGRKLFPPQMHVIGKVAGTAANADVSAVLNALKNNAPAQEVYKAATGLLNNVIDDVLKNNPDIKKEWYGGWGGDEKPDIISYAWDVIFDKHPELLEAFSARENISDEMNDLNMLAYMTGKSSSKGMDENIIGSLVGYLNKPR